MNNFKANLIGVLALVLIFSIFYFLKNNNQDLNIEVKKNDINNKELFESKDVNKKTEINAEVKNVVKKEENKIVESVNQPKSLKQNKKIINKEVDNKENIKPIEKINKKVLSLDQLRKDLNDKKDNFNFNKDKSINYLLNEESDPFINPLPPYDIDRIKEKAKQFEPTPVSENDVVTLKTNKGTMKLKLFSDVAPKHCYNFKKLANSGFYDGTIFHRIIPNFMIQGGDILSRDGNKKNDGQGGPGWNVDAEFNDIKHTKGILSMARSSDPNSAGSQFFICHADAPHLDGKYTAFGEVIENLEIIDKIVNAPTGYSETKKLCSNSIPNSAKAEDWVELLDPKTRRKLYAKVPQSFSKASFKHEMNEKLRDNNPMYAIRIFSIRVD